MTKVIENMILTNGSVEKQFYQSEGVYYYKECQKNNNLFSISIKAKQLIDKQLIYVLISNWKLFKK